MEARERPLPNFKVGDAITNSKAEVTEHETKPPNRYSEASLIQFLEKEGIAFAPRAQGSLAGLLRQLDPPFRFRRPTHMEASP
jgi:DNA topoisomerase-1